MNTLSKNIIAGILGFGAVITSGSAGATPFFTGNMNYWHDNLGLDTVDGDSEWAFSSLTGTVGGADIGPFGGADPFNIWKYMTVTMDESETAQGDNYSITFHWNDGQTGQGHTPYYPNNMNLLLEYTVKLLPVKGDEYFISARSDTDGGVDGYQTIKTVTTTPSSIAIELTSLNGQVDGPKLFSGKPTFITVREQFITDDAGQLASATNRYLVGEDTTVPEIDTLAGTGALSLLAGALALAGERRRREAPKAAA